MASRKCGTDLNIFIDLVSTMGKNVDSRPINAREIAQLLEKLLQDLIDPQKWCQNVQNSSAVQTAGECHQSVPVWNISVDVGKFSGSISELV